MLHAFNPRNIPTIVPLKYGLNEGKIICSNYGNNKVNIYQEQRNEASAIQAILKCSEEIFYQQCSEYLQLISRKKAERMKEHEIKKRLLISKLKEHGKNKKCTTKSMKQTKDQLETVVNKIKNHFSLEEAVYLSFEILSYFTTVFTL